MIKLYYAPGACSLSPHVALREASLPFSLELVDFRDGRKVPGGKVLADVNGKGQVPALVLENGEVLTEGAAIVQYVADLAPAAKLAPAAGTFERVRLQEWLNFIATELHKGLGPFFSPIASDEYKAARLERLAARFAHVEKSLEGKCFLLGDTFTIADGYMLWALRSYRNVAKGTLGPALEAYEARIVARPAVRAALEAEGLA